MSPERLAEIEQLLVSGERVHNRPIIAELVAEVRRLTLIDNATEKAWLDGIYRRVKAESERDDWRTTAKNISVREVKLRDDIRAFADDMETVAKPHRPRRDRERLAVLGIAKELRALLEAAA